MSENIAEILERAAARVERAWTQGANARDADGTALANRDGWMSDDATCWCLEGAIRAEMRLAGYDDFTADGAFYDVTELFDFGSEPPCEWNDAPGRTQAEVVQALREAARRARLEQR